MFNEMGNITPLENEYLVEGRRLNTAWSASNTFPVLRIFLSLCELCGQPSSNHGIFSNMLNGYHQSQQPLIRLDKPKAPFVHRDDVLDYKLQEESQEQHQKVQNIARIHNQQNKMYGPFLRPGKPEFPYWTKEDIFGPTWALGDSFIVPQTQKQLNN